MHKKQPFILPLFFGVLLLLLSSFAFVGVKPAKAQCGSQASSCKTCHEVQAQDSVNADGTQWHQSHAFGDFCYICHAGNQQATDKAAAHQGMVSPMTDVKASCQQCHAADLEARAKVYADILGVQASTGSTTQASSAPVAVAAATEAAPSTASDPSFNQVAVDDPNAVNYKQNYDEIVLGKKPINWGNMILIGMIGFMVVVGGGFVVTREKLVNVKFGDTSKVNDEYPADVVEMLPEITKLKPGSRKSLKNLLTSKKADQVLDLIDAIVKKEDD
jgi:hypothetical protein